MKDPQEKLKDYETVNLSLVKVETERSDKVMKIEYGITLERF